VPGPWSFLLPSVVSIVIVWTAFAVSDDLAGQVGLIAFGVVVTLGLYTGWVWRRRRRLQRDE
jgi:O-antigen/teichoic acid export membrane protein